MPEAIIIDEDGEDITFTAPETPLPITLVFDVVVSKVQVLSSKQGICTVIMVSDFRKAS